MQRDLIISTSNWQKMLMHAESCLPEEACGMLVGLSNRVYEVIPTENILHSEFRYQIDPRQQLTAFQYIDDRGWELVGIYHSHPKGPPVPSMTDITEAYYPEAVYIILSMGEESFISRGFKIAEGNVNEISIIIGT